MRRIAWLTVMASLVWIPLAGCATCPDGRCSNSQVMDDDCGGECAHCGSDGILPTGFPCDHCGPRLLNPLSGRPIRNSFRDLLTCGGGCGEVYWGEWLSDPPACCDPCENLGNCHRRGFLANCWATIAGDCGNGGCVDPCGYTTRSDRLQDPYLPSGSVHEPVAPPPAPPTVVPDDLQPDQKAVRPRRVIRR